MTRPNKQVMLGTDHDGQPATTTAVERSTHLHVIGASSRGKSRFLEQLIRQDIRQRHGLCLIDPHGELYAEVVRWCAHHGVQHRRRVHLLNPNDLDWTMGFDPLRCSDPAYLSRTIDGAVAAFAQVWGGEDTSKTPLLKRCLRAIFYLLVKGDRPLSDAMSVILKDDPQGLRAELTAGIDDPIFEMVWAELDSMSAREFRETFSSTSNRLLEFLANPSIRRMFIAKEQALDVSTCMEQGDIILVNLQPAVISADNARLIGTLLTNALFNNAIRRDPRAAGRKPFYLYIDECYQFLTEDVEAMLDQTRKFGLHVILAHQHLAQLRKYGEHVFNAVMTNTGSKVVFGGLPEGDAELMAKQVLRSTFDFNRPKHLLDKPVVVGFEKVTMHHEGRADGVAVSESSSSMTASMHGMSMGSSQMFGADGHMASGATESQGISEAFSTGEGYSSGMARSVVVSRGQSESWLPILEERPTTVESEAEVLHRAILGLRSLPKRRFVLVTPYAEPRLIETPEVLPATIRPARVQAFEHQVRSASPYLVPTAALVAAQSIPDVVDEDEEDDPFSVPEE